MVGTSRQLVVLPTNTWQAYNFWDKDGDGWGDTWYAGYPNTSVVRNRPYMHRGVPPFFYRYDQGFLHWLYWNDHTVDFLAESDLDGLSGDDLAGDYDLVVYPGHSEYVTTHEYDVITRYRDLGGNLIFLSANNFFWHVAETGMVITRDKQWRDLGRPEAALIGVQYLANDRGDTRACSRRSTPPRPPGSGRAPVSPGLDPGRGGGRLRDRDRPHRAASPPARSCSPRSGPLRAGADRTDVVLRDRGGREGLAAGTLDFGGSALTVPVAQMLGTSGPG